MALNASIITMMQSDIMAAVSDWSATLTYKGQTVSGTWSPVTKGATLDGDGMISESGAEFVCVRSLFTTEIPKQRSVVDVDGTKYVVTSYTDDPAAITLRLDRSDDSTSTGGIL